MGHRRSRGTVESTLHGRLQGHVSWEVLDGDGAVLQSGSQKNLILDNGLNVFGTDTNHGATTAGSYFAGWRNYFAIGTGSTAPAASQTTLTAEVMRGASNGGFTAEQMSSAAVSGASIVGTFTIVRVLDITAAYNLTEFGFSALPSANAALTIRELFRDGSNNPVTISVQSGQQLKMTHTLTITLTPYQSQNAAAFTLTGVGALSGYGTWALSVVNSNNLLNIFSNVFNPNTTNNLYTMTAANDGGTNSNVAYDNNPVTATVAAYVSGSYQRVKTGQYSTSQVNFDHYGWLIGSVSAGNNYTAYKFALTNPVKVTKSSLNKLSLSFTVSWGR